MDRDLSFSFTDLPVTNKYEGLLIILDIDATGGFASPIWPASVVNPPIIPTTPSTRFSVLLYTIDNGTIVTHATSTGSSSSSVNQWSTFPAIQTVSMATNGMTGLTIANIVDTGGVARGSISGDATLGLVLSTASSGKLSIQDVITPIATFDDTTGLTMDGTHVINMGQNIINTIGSLQFDNAVTFTPIAVNTIGFDAATNAMKYNVALTSDIHSFQAAGELLASITRIGSNLGQITASSIIANNNLQANETLFLASFNNTVPINGDVWRDSGTGNFQFRENGVTQGLGGEFFGPWTANHDAGGFALTNILRLDSNAAFIPSSGKIRLGNNELVSWLKIDNVSTVSLGLRTTDLLGITGGDLSLTGNDIVDTNLLEGRFSNPLNINIPTASQLLNFQFGGVTEWILSESTLSGDNVLLNNTLTINDSSTDPVADGIFSRNGSVLGLQIPTFQVQRATTGASFGDFNLTKVDAAPSGGEPIYKINFNLFDSPTSITYAQIGGGIIDVTDAGALISTVRANGGDIDVMNIEGRSGTSKADIEFLDQTIIKSSSSGEIGIFVTSDPSNLDSIGTSGTLQIPRTAINPTTVNELDVRFGDFLGAFGIATGLTERLWVKVAASRWLGFDFDAAITS